MMPPTRAARDMDMRPEMKTVYRVAKGDPFTEKQTVTWWWRDANGSSRGPFRTRDEARAARRNSMR